MLIGGLVLLGSCATTPGALPPSYPSGLSQNLRAPEVCPTASRILKRTDAGAVPHTRLATVNADPCM